MASFAFALGDVAGKGAPAALLTAVLQGIFSGHTATMKDPGDTMARVNRALLSRAVEARFATAFLGVLGPDGRLVYCNAGHNPPFVFGSGVPRRLTAGGLVLGLFAHASYEQEVVQLEAGDTVVLFSDGVSEALSVSGDEFGDDRIVETVGFGSSWNAARGARRAARGGETVRRRCAAERRHHGTGPPVQYRLFRPLTPSH